MQVIAVKRNAAKIVVSIVALIALICGGLYFNNTFKLSVTSRTQLAHHQKMDVKSAKIEQEIAQKTAELQSHLVSEV